MTFDDIRRMTRDWPGVADAVSYRTPALKVRGKLLARLREDGETLVLPGVGLDERDMLLAAAPAVFFITPHYRDHPMVLMRLPAAHPDAAEALLRRRWREIAAKAAVKAFDAAQAAA